MYSTYQRNFSVDSECEAYPSNRKKIIILGGGPNRIGQGIEFDYGCVHAVKAIREAGMDAVLMNNNPETVSTDFDTSDRLYFEPLTLEYVTEVLLREHAHGILLQFGGQTAINLALPLESRLSVLNMPLDILGTTCDAIDEASDRERFEAFAERIGLQMPRGATGTSGRCTKSSRKDRFPCFDSPIICFRWKRNGNSC